MPSGRETVATPRQRRGEWLNAGALRDKGRDNGPRYAVLT